MSKEIAQAVIAHTLDRLTFSEVKELYEAIDSPLYGDCDDFCIDFNGCEYRIIDSDKIWEIYVEGIKEITQDCYLVENSVPSWMSVDWEETAQNCYADGYGRHFSSYDGDETEHNGYWVFRTN